MDSDQSDVFITRGELAIACSSYVSLGYLILYTTTDRQVPKPTSIHIIYTKRINYAHLAVRTTRG